MVESIAASRYPSIPSGTTPATLAPYLRASATGTFTSTNIISFFLGNQVSGMRNRKKTVDGSSTCLASRGRDQLDADLVGAPRERFDILYGDQGLSGILPAVEESTAGRLSRRERRDAPRLQWWLFSPGRRRQLIRCRAWVLHHRRNRR